MKKLSLFVATLVLAACSVAVGQSHVHMQAVTSGSTQMNIIQDMSPYCQGGAAGVNCWDNQVGFPSGISITKLTISPGVAPLNGAYRIATDTNGCAWEYSDPGHGGNNTWGQGPWGCGIDYMTIASNGGNYALYSSCSGGKLFGQWGTSSFIPRAAGCYKAFSMDRLGSGDTVFVDANSAVWLSTNFGTTVQQEAACSGNGGASSVAVIHDQVIAIACNDASLWYGNVANNNWNRLPGAGYHVAADFDRIYVTGTDNNIYRWILGISTSWLHYVNVTAATNVSFDPWTHAAWAIVNGAPLKMTEWGLMGIRNYNTTTQCIGGPCPTLQQGVYHIAKTHMEWLYQGVVASSGNYANTGHVQPAKSNYIQSSAVLGTPSLCFLDPNNCKVYTDDEEYDCSVQGTLATDGGQSASTPMGFVTATVRLETTSAPTCTQDITAATPDTCTYPVVPYCTNTTTPAISVRWGMDSISTDQYMDAEDVCTQVQGGPLVCPSTISGHIWASQRFQQDPGTTHCTTLLGN